MSPGLHAENHNFHRDGIQTQGLWGFSLEGGIHKKQRNRALVNGTLEGREELA